MIRIHGLIKVSDGSNSVQEEPKAEMAVYIQGSVMIAGQYFKQDTVLQASASRIKFIRFQNRPYD